MFIREKYKEETRNMFQVFPMINFANLVRKNPFALVYPMCAGLPHKMDGRENAKPVDFTKIVYTIVSKSCSYVLI